jgi:hypothetical protein
MATQWQHNGGMCHRARLSLPHESQHAAPGHSLIATTQFPVNNMFVVDSAVRAANMFVVDSAVRADLPAPAGMLVDECNAGHFNSQSTANAWWAVSKLLPGGHPLAAELFLALETALLGCLSNPSEADRPNSQVGIAGRALALLGFWAWGLVGWGGLLPCREFVGRRC